MLWLHYRVYNNNVDGEVNVIGIVQSVQYANDRLVCTLSSSQMKMEIAEKTRTLEFIGLSISLVALIASLVIFCRFR